MTHRVRCDIATSDGDRCIHAKLITGRPTRIVDGNIMKGNFSVIVALLGVLI